MTRFISLALAALLIGCAHSQPAAQPVSRGIASVDDECDYHSLGTPAQNNYWLTVFNGRRMLALNSMITRQIEKLQSRFGTDKRVTTLQGLITKIQFPNIKAWDDVQDVTKKLHEAFTLYLADITDDEAHGLITDTARKNLEYANKTYAPKIESVEYWAPEACSNHSAPAAQSVLRTFK